MIPENEQGKEINQEALRAVVEIMKNYRPGLSETVIEKRIQEYLDNDRIPLADTSQDCVFAYQRALHAISGLSSP